MVIALALIVGGGVWGAVALKQDSSLLPTDVTKRITTFTPYFYEQAIPGDYRLDDSQIVYDGQILMLPLTKPQSSTIVLTEQVLARHLSDEDIQQNGEGVTVNTGKATINDIEGRLVGTLIPSDRRTLILLNSSGDTNKDNLRALLQALRPVQSKN